MSSRILLSFSLCQLPLILSELRGEVRRRRLGDQKDHVVLPADFSKPSIQSSYFWIFPYGRVLAYGDRKPMGVLIRGSQDPSSWLSMELTGFSDSHLCWCSPQCRGIEKSPSGHFCWGLIPEFALPTRAWLYAPADELFCYGQGGRGGMSEVQSIPMFVCLHFCAILISLFLFRSSHLGCVEAQSFSINKSREYCMAP